MNYMIESDGRWIADVTNFHGVLTYRNTREEAIPVVPDSTNGHTRIKDKIAAIRKRVINYHL
jgi:hypothetical protein